MKVWEEEWIVDDVTGTIRRKDGDAPAFECLAVGDFYRDPKGERARLAAQAPAMARALDSALASLKHEGCSPYLVEEIESVLRDAGVIP